MGAQESTEEAPELEDGQSESKEELTTPTRFRRRSRSEPPDPRAAEALSPTAIDLQLVLSPANVDPRLRPPARVRASSTIALFPEESYAESVSAVLCSKFVVVQVILNVVASVVGPIVIGENSKGCSCATSKAPASMPWLFGFLLWARRRRGDQ